MSSRLTHAVAVGANVKAVQRMLGHGGVDDGLAGPVRTRITRPTGKRSCAGEPPPGTSPSTCPARRSSKRSTSCRQTRCKPKLTPKSAGGSSSSRPITRKLVTRSLTSSATSGWPLCSWVGSRKAARLSRHPTPWYFATSSSDHSSEPPRANPPGPTGRSFPHYRSRTRNASPAGHTGRRGAGDAVHRRPDREYFRAHTGDRHRTDRNRPDQMGAHLSQYPASAHPLRPTRTGRERLVPHMNEGNRAKTASAPAVAVLAVDTQFYEHTPTLLPFRPELKDVFAANEAMRTTSGMFNATLQAGYFILSIRAHGLAAGPMSGFDAASIDAEFVPDGRWHRPDAGGAGTPHDRIGGSASDPVANLKWMPAHFRHRALTDTEADAAATMAPQYWTVHNVMRRPRPPPRRARRLLNNRSCWAGRWVGHGNRGRR